MRGANRFEEDALKHGRDDLIFFIREEKIVRGKRTRTSLRKRRKKRETRANKERAFKGSIRIARINIMHKYKRKTQTHTYLLSYCDTQLDDRPSSLGSAFFTYISLSLIPPRVFSLFLNAQNQYAIGLLFLLLFLVVVWRIYGPKCFNRRFPTFHKKDIIRRIRSKLQNTHARVCLYHSRHTHTHALLNKAWQLFSRAPEETMTTIVAAQNQSMMIASSSSGMNSSSSRGVSSTTSPKTLRALSSLQSSSSSQQRSKNRSRVVVVSSSSSFSGVRGKRRALLSSSSFAHQSRARNPLAGLSSRGARGFVRYNFQEDDDNVSSTTLNKKRRFQNVCPRNSNFPSGNSATEIEDCLSDEECKDQLIEGLEKSLSSSRDDEKEEEKKKEETKTKTAVSSAEGETKPKKREFVNAKGYDGDECSVDEDNCAVSEPPLNFGRLRSVGTISRSFEIWTFAFTFVIRRVSLGLKWTYKGGYTEEKRTARLERLAKWLRLGLLRLGPTFIKVGQQFSTRVDVLSPQFIRELEKLQDRVPPFPTDIAREILTEELGKPIDDVFDDFDDVALAAASLGQVHLAKLKTTGEQVIIKVQRPGLKEIFDIDLKNLRVIAKWLQSVDPKNDGAKRDWVAIFDETARVLYDEVDYTNEAQNATDFAKQFETQDWIKVPKIFWDYTSRRAMCMEYVPATKINDLAGIQAMNVDPDRMARLAVEAYLQQVLRFGFFHADPHPGNVAVDNKDPEGKGRLVVYDYGMMGRIPDETRAGLLDLFYATYEGSSKSATKALIKMGVLVDTGGDLTAVERTAGFFLEAFGKRINYQESKRAEDKEAFEKEFKEPRTKEEKQAVRKKILTNIGEDLMVVSKDQPFRFPAEFTFVVVRFIVCSICFFHYSLFVSLFVCLFVCIFALEKGGIYTKERVTCVCCEENSSRILCTS